MGNISDPPLKCHYMYLKLLTSNTRLSATCIDNILDVNCISSVLSSSFSVKVSILHQTMYNQQMTFPFPIPNTLHPETTQATDSRIHKTSNERIDCENEKNNSF